jgi:mannose-6-phosphate isomerase-like protein (cupin superfamily)
LDGSIMLSKIVLAQKLAQFTETWSPRIVGDVNDCQVKLAKLEGEFVWHQHEHEDELFLVIEGRLRMELRDGVVVLEPGELLIVPRGVEHRPVAERACSVLLFEPASTLNTGDVASERTIRQPERL